MFTKGLLVQTYDCFPSSNTSNHDQNDLLKTPWHTPQGGRESQGLDKKINSEPA